MLYNFVISTVHESHIIGLVRAKIVVRIMLQTRNNKKLVLKRKNSSNKFSGVALKM